MLPFYLTPARNPRDSIREVLHKNTLFLEIYTCSKFNPATLWFLLERNVYLREKELEKVQPNVLEKPKLTFLLGKQRYKWNSWPDLRRLLVYSKVCVNPFTLTECASTFIMAPSTQVWMHKLFSF